MQSGPAVDMVDDAWPISLIAFSIISRSPCRNNGSQPAESGRVSPATSKPPRAFVMSQSNCNHQCPSVDTLLIENGRRSSDSQVMHLVNLVFHHSHHQLGQPSAMAGQSDDTTEVIALSDVDRSIPRGPLELLVLHLSER